MSRRMKSEHHSQRFGKNDVRIRPEFHQQIMSKSSSGHPKINQVRKNTSSETIRHRSKNMLDEPMPNSWNNALEMFLKNRQTSSNDNSIQKSMSKEGRSKIYTNLSLGHPWGTSVRGFWAVWAPGSRAAANYQRNRVIRDWRELEFGIC